MAVWWGGSYIESNFSERRTILRETKISFKDVQRLLRGEKADAGAQCLRIACKEIWSQKQVAWWCGSPCSADISSPPWGLEPDSTKFASKMAKMLPPLDGQWTKSTNFHFIIWSVGKKEDKAKALTLLPPKIRFSAGKNRFERFHCQVSDILENMSQCLRMDRHMFFCSFSVVLRQEIFSSCPLCRKCFSQFFQLPCIQIKFDKKNLPRQPSQYLH